MPEFIQVYSTSIVGGIAAADSVLITVAIYGSSETIDPGDGATLRIIDSDDDGLIDRMEFNSATGGGGLGQNGGGLDVLFDQDSNPNTGTLYSSDPFSSGDDLNSLINGLSSNFPDVDPEVLAICFAHGTRIMTYAGECAVELLRIGDAVKTIDHGHQPIRWIGSQRLSKSVLTRNPKLRPVRIVAGALGNNLPERDLLVSRQHRMVISSKIAERITGSHDVLVPAIKLKELSGIFVDEGVEQVEYFHILFDEHEVIFAEGAPTESLYTGPEALKAVSPEAREEILTIFPKLKDRDYTPDPALLIPALKTQKKIVARHAKKQKPILADYTA